MITFEVAYTWLDQFSGTDTQLGRSARQMKRSIEEAVAEREYAQAHVLIDRFERIGRTSSNSGETGEICIACARAHYDMGELDQALKQLDEAMKHYIADAHRLAVVQWLKGCLLWDMPGREAEAAEFWQRSLEAFSALGKRHLVLQQGAEWYQQRCSKMVETIQAASPGGRDAGRASQELYGIFEKLDPKSAEMPEPVTRVKANQFWIGSRMYQLISLSDQAVMDVGDAPRLYALKVETDSMDLVGIEAGDYLLVRWLTKPQPDTLVAVFIDDEAETLKVLSLNQEKDKFVLTPHSRNPKQQAREFPGMSQGFQIKGEVLGVFKPI